MTATVKKPSRSPSLIEVLRYAMDQASGEIFVALPGKVVSYSPSKQTADIKPLLKKDLVFDDGTEEAEALPILPEVPVVFPRGGGYFLSFPLEAGDNVLLVFCDRSIDSYSQSSGAVDIDPIDLRTHDIADAVAIPGFFPNPRALRDPIGRGAVLGKEGGTQVRARGDTVEITTRGAEAAAGGFVALSQKIDLLWLALTVALDAWVAKQPPPTPDGGVALAAALSAAIKLVPSYQATASSNLKAD
jgi:hypothetical protein